MDVYIPPREHVIETDEADPLKWCYFPGIRYFYIKRFEMVLEALGSARGERMLDVGFGSGVFLPELSRRTDWVYGIDLHDHAGGVRAGLRAEGLAPCLGKASALDLPFRSEVFDVVVSVSVLEHIVDVGHAVKEIYRVLKKGGIAGLGFPVRNTISTAALKVLGLNLSTTVEERHPSSHTAIVASLQETFPSVSVTWFPRWVSLDLSLYCVCRCAK